MPWARSRSWAPGRGRRRGGVPWGVLGVQAGAGALTGAWWGRQQARMDQVRREDGSLDPRYESLMTSHWLRIGLIATAAAGQFAIAARALAVRDGPSHPPLAGATGPSTIRPDAQGGLHGPR